MNQHQKRPGWPPSVIDMGGAADPARGRPVLKAAGVAWLLNMREDNFRNRRPALEAAGFPKKLPGINGWSRACVLRWIETNGESIRPDGPVALEVAAAQLEEEYE
ncbi:MAG: hypothetical protein ABJG86_11225 [Nitratireductor sp.]